MKLTQEKLKNKTMILTKEIIIVTKFKDFYTVEDFIKFQEENRHVEIVEKHTATVVAPALYTAPGSDGHIQNYKDTSFLVTRVYYREEHHVKMKIDPNDGGARYKVFVSPHATYTCFVHENKLITEHGVSVKLDKIIKTEILK